MIIFKTISKNVQSQIIEKKSKFICNIYPIENVKNANELIKQTKKQYYNAKHNCYAYSIYDGNHIVTKCSDDGEPSKTAGAPILSIIKNNNLSNVLVVVTRYFGGILLGTGGLVRAYSSATESALEMATIIEKQEGYEVNISIDYSEFEKVNHYLAQNNVKIIKVEYLEKIKILIETNEKNLEKITENNNKKILNILKVDKKIIDI